MTLEEQATEIIMAARKGVTAIRDKNDILSPEQLELRHSREVYNERGVADAALFRGIYHRAWSSMPKRPRRYSRALDPWRQDAYESFPTS